jgi:hypothetical protein
VALRAARFARPTQTLETPKRSWRSYSAEAISAEAINAGAINAGANNAEAINAEAINGEAINAEAIDAEAIDAGSEATAGAKRHSERFYLLMAPLTLASRSASSA